jgi:hypothetical protein
MQLFLAYQKIVGTLSILQSFSSIVKVDWDLREGVEICMLPLKRPMALTTLPSTAALASY